MLDEFDANFKDEELTLKDLSPQLIEEVYRKMEEAYRLKDVKRHSQNILDKDVLSSLTEDDYRSMVYMHVDEMDCNIAENKTWEYVINRYIKLFKKSCIS